MDTTSIITIFVLGAACVANIMLGGIVLLQNSRQWLNWSFFLFTLSAAAWVATNLFYAVIADHAVQFIFALLSYGAAGLLALFFVLYCIQLVHVRLGNYAMVAIWSVGLAVTIGSMMPGVIATEITADSRIVTNTLPLVLYALYLLLYMGCGIAVLLHARRTVRGNDRNRITIVLLGLVCAALFGLSLNLILPMTGNYKYVAIGPVASLILAGSSTYAIVRHRLFDVKLAAVRAIAYLGALLTLSGVYYVLAYFLSIVTIGRQSGSHTVTLQSVALALILAFLFQPVKRLFDKITDDIFYHDSYKTDQFFAELNQLLVSTTDLRGLLLRVSVHVADTLKAEQVFFYCFYGDGADRYISVGTPQHARLPIYDIRALDAYMKNVTDATIEVDMLHDASTLKRTLLGYHIALIVPLRRDDVTIGYIFLGQHRGGSYAKRDLGALATISNELVIAIENALSLHEVRELNATLQQRIDTATKKLRSSNAQLKHLDVVKDEFMSMASHQLRTPLTSIKGYLSMVLEGDAGTITPQQHKLLSEAFGSSERMVRLIADFLNVSRLQTGKFAIEKTDVDLRKIVKQEVANLQIVAASRDLKLELDSVDEALPLHGDEGKLRQMIMNFIDNAIYYSQPETTITVNLQQKGEECEFTVTDTGIGVPKDEQAQLFHKFYRATNARKQRPDGTGVGLYLARKVITAHGGKIIFESVEGKGSTFGFRLPLTKTTTK